MSLCINPCCNYNNPDDADNCQKCGMSLLIEGRYRLIREMQRNPGTYTTVYEVENIREPGTRKVLKALQQIRTDDRDFRSKLDILTRLFDQEVKLLIEFARSAPPQDAAHGVPQYVTNFIVPLWNSARFPETPASLRCLVMEKIEGINLEHWMESPAKLESEATALDWLKQLVKILDHIHTLSEGYIHRDIKPANIILKSDNRLVLVDFGTAREVPQPGMKTTVVQSPGYTASEQIEGRVELRSDFYALGRTFMHLLTGEHPERLAYDFRTPWAEKTAFPKSGLIHLIEHLCAREVEHRPSSAQEILAQIDILQAQVKHPPKHRKVKIRLPRNNKTHVPSIGQRTLPPSSPLGLRLRRRTWGVLILAALLGLLVVVLQLCQSVPSPVVPPPSVSISFGQKLIEGSRDLKGQKYQDLRAEGIRAYESASNESADNAQRISDYENAYRKFDEIRKDVSTTLKGERTVGQDNANAKPNARDALVDVQTLIFRNNALSMMRSLRDNTPLFRIAVVTPAHLPEGQQVLFGIGLAQEKFVDSNKQHNLVIGITNDDNNGDKAKEVAEGLVNLQLKVLAVVGHYTSDTTCAALSIYSQKKIPLISSTSSVTSKEGKPFREFCGDSNGVFFRTNSTTQEEARRLLEVLPPQAKVIAYFNSDDTYTKDLLNQFKTQLGERGGSVVNNLDDNFNLNNDGFAAADSNLALNFIKKTWEGKDFDAIALFVDGMADSRSRSTIAAYRIIQANEGSKQILGSAPLYHARSLSGLDLTTLQNLVLAVDWDRNCNQDQGFQKDTQQKGWDGFNRRMAQSYEAVQALSEALTQGAVDSQGLIQKLRSLNIKSDVTRNARIRFKNEPVHPFSSLNPFNLFKEKTSNGDREGLEPPKRVQVKSRQPESKEFEFSPLGTESC